VERKKKQKEIPYKEGILKVIGSHERYPFMYRRVGI
jgi:hypothetical protein